jgi:hypothetical protein
MGTITCAGSSSPVDDLLLFPFGLERNAARRLIHRGDLKARKIGRRWYAKRSDVLALIDQDPFVPPATASGADLRADLTSIASRMRAK